MNNNSETNQPVPAKRKPPVTRIVVTALVIVLTLAAIGVAIPWAHYRYRNIVLREAAVRGSVTQIGARIDGRIQSVEGQAGQRVTQGQVLVRMEDAHLQAALQRARGELASATRELESEKLGIEPNRRRLALEIERCKGSLRKAQGDLEGQQSSLTKLEKQYERISALVKTGAVAVAELDKVTGDRDKALAMVNGANGVLEAAQSNHEKAINELEGLQVREKHLGVLEAQITIARAKVATAEAELDSSIIKAPEAGRVIERIVNVGGSAKVGEPIISLWIGKPWVEAWADERDLHQIQPGSPVDISFDATPSRRLAGHVESIGLVTDKQLQPATVPTTLHAFVRQNAMVPIRIALDEDGEQEGGRPQGLSLGLSVLVGIRKGGEGTETISRNPQNKSTAGVATGGQPQGSSRGATTNSVTKQ